MLKRIRNFVIVALVLLIAILSPAYGNGTANLLENQAPVAVGKIDPVTIGVGPVTVDVSDKFSDADGDTLYFTAAMGNVAIATVSVDSGKVTVSPESVFSATITVTAADWCGRSAAQTIAVKMSQTPVALGTIDPVTISNDSVTVDVSGKFSYVDGDTLYFTAVVGDIAIATVSVDGGKVTIKPGAKAGNTTVTVTATNLWGLRATQNIGVVREENTLTEKIVYYVLAPIGIVGISLPIFLNFSVNISPNFNIDIGPKYKIRQNQRGKPQA